MDRARTHWKSAITPATSQAGDRFAVAHFVSPQIRKPKRTLRHV
jgi:hypothetical protein